MNSPNFYEPYEDDKSAIRKTVESNGFIIFTGFSLIALTSAFLYYMKPENTQYPVVNATPETPLSIPNTTNSKSESLQTKQNIQSQVANMMNGDESSNQESKSHKQNTVPVKIQPNSIQNSAPQTPNLDWKNMSEDELTKKGFSTFEPTLRQANNEEIGIVEPEYHLALGTLQSEGIYFFMNPKNEKAYFNLSKGMNQEKYTPNELKVIKNITRQYMIHLYENALNYVGQDNQTRGYLEKHLNILGNIPPQSIFTIPIKGSFMISSSDEFIKFPIGKEPNYPELLKELQTKAKNVQFTPTEREEVNYILQNPHFTKDEEQRSILLDLYYKMDDEQRRKLDTQIRDFFREKYGEGDYVNSRIVTLYSPAGWTLSTLSDPNTGETLGIPLYSPDQEDSH